MVKSVFILLLLGWPPSVFAVGHIKEITETYRRDAEVAQKKGDLLGERNAWHKYLELEELEPERKPGEPARIKNRLVEIERQLKAPVAVSLPVEAPQVPVVQQKTAARPTARVSSAELLKKARVLQQNGQLDEALRFYKLAGAADPASEEIRRETEILQKEMN